MNWSNAAKINRAFYIHPWFCTYSADNHSCDTISRRWWYPKTLKHTQNYGIHGDRDRVCFCSPT